MLRAALPPRQMRSASWSNCAGTVDGFFESDGASEGAQVRFRIFDRLGVRRRGLAVGRGLGRGPFFDDVAVLIETDVFHFANGRGSVDCCAV